MRCRSRRTSSSTWPQLTANHAEAGSSGQFTPTEAGASNMSVGSGVAVIDHLHRLTRPAWAPFRAEAPGPVSGRLYVAQPKEAASATRSRRLSAAGIRFSGHPTPAGELTPSSRSAYRPRPDPVGVTTFHTHETRTDWAPSVPRGRWCSPVGPCARASGICRFSATSPCSIRSSTPSTDLQDDEASTKGSLTFARPSPRP